MPELTEGHGHQHCYVTNNDNMFVNSAKLDLYHRTTPEAAEQINKQKSMNIGKENTGETYWSTHKDSDQAEGYGQGVVHIRVPENVAELDDEFPSGEQHYRVHPRHIKPEHFVEEK